MKASARTRPPGSEPLLDEIHAIAAQAEKLLGATLSECLGEDGARLRQRLGTAHAQLAEVCGRARDGVKARARQAEAEARAHPYQAVALALGVGALLGALIQARRRGGHGPEAGR